jgi:hypothetical protein
LKGTLRVPFQLTPYDWLIFGGLAVNCVAFLLMFNRRA